MLPLSLFKAHIAEEAPPDGGGDASDFFASNGFANISGGAAYEPLSSYIADTDTTWYVWESAATPGSAQRQTSVRTYNHTTQTWSASTVVGNNPLINDSHGLPVIERNPNTGLVYCFWGAHNATQLKVARTTNADDPSAWTALSDTGTGPAYPKPIWVNDSLHLFYRSSDNNDNNGRYYRVQHTTSLAGGTPTWSSPIALLDYDVGGNGGRVYVGNLLQSGTEVIFAAMRADLADTYRLDCYLYRYDTAANTIKNIDGSVTISSGSFPVNLTTSNASFTAAPITSIGKFGGGLNIIHDTNGNLHLLYGIRDVDTDPDVAKHRMWNGSSWTADVDVLGGIMSAADNGVIYFYWDETFDTVAYQRREANGTLGSVTTGFTKPGSVDISPAVTRNGRAGARIWINEFVAETIEQGDLKIWAYDPETGILQV